MRKTSDLVMGAVAMGLGCYLLFSDSIIQGKTLFNPEIYWSQADSYLRILGFVMAFLSAILMLRWLFTGRKREEPISSEGAGILKYRLDWLVISSFTSLILYMILIPWIGFLPASFLLIWELSFSFRLKETGLDWHDRKKTAKALVSCGVYAVVMVSIMSFVFSQFLNVTLPQ